MKTFFAFLLLIISLVIANEVNFNPEGQTLSQEYFHSMISKDKVEILKHGVKSSELYNTMLKSIMEFAHNIKLPPKYQEQLDQKHYSNKYDSKYPYFDFIPSLISRLKKESTKEFWSAPCFKTSSASYVKKGTDTVQVSLEVSKASSPFCSDFYLFATLDSFEIKDIFSSGKYTIELKANTTDIAVHDWDLATSGVRVFLFNGNPIDTIDSLLKTLKMYEGVFNETIPKDVVDANVDFMKKYNKMDYPKRKSPKFLTIPEEEIHSGDIIIIYRPDGTDSMMCMGMGSVAGHVVSFLRIDGELYVVEAQSQSEYWPLKDGIQRNKYSDWMAQAKKSEYNFLYLRLKEEKRRQFDEKKAAEWFKTVEGLEYGFPVMLLGWLDILKQNFPCFAPDFKRCVEWDVFEVVFPIAEMIAPEPIRKFWVQPMNNRLQTNVKTIGEVYKKAHEKGIWPASKLVEMVELDSYNYKHNKAGKEVMGPAMVCCGFSCRLWKEAGLFGEMKKDINCNEFTVLDDYKLNWFDTERPQVCKQDQPGSLLCQLGGPLEIPKLPRFNTVTAKSHMTEKCPSRNPDFVQPDDC